MHIRTARLATVVLTAALALGGGIAWLARATYQAAPNPTRSPATAASGRFSDTDCTTALPVAAVQTNGAAIRPTINAKASSGLLSLAGTISRLMTPLTPAMRPLE